MKKLTAGIFTALLGLVTVNAANAAIPSTNYVDDRISGVVDAYQAADKALGTRIDGVVTAYQQADTALDGRVDALETRVGEGEMVVATKPQADVIAAINALDEKTNGIASNTALETLQTTVTGHGTDITDLKKRMGTAESEIDGLQAADTTMDAAIDANTQAITDNANATTEALALKADKSALGTLAAKSSVATSDLDSTLQAAVGQVATNTQAIADNANATTEALALKADKSALGALAAKDTVATSDLDSTLQAAVGQVATNKSGIESLNTTVGTKADQSALDATNTEVAKKADAATMTTELAKKVDIAQGAEAANRVVITDASGNVVTSATITQAQVADLTTTITNLQNNKVTIPTATGTDGTYVLTATTVGDDTTYKWESIERNVATPASGDDA